MKQIITLFTLLLSITIHAQENAFVVDFSNNLKAIDLSDATLQVIGATTRSYGGMDFGPDNILYGLDYNSNELYSIDTADATETLIGSSIPPSTHIWTGMAYDATNGIMYANASHGIATGSSNLYTIDLADGSITLVGSQTDVTAFGAIGIDEDGQLYGLQLSASPSIYLIDNTDASVTYLGDCNAFGGAGMGYGMDFNPDDQTMYLTAYDSFTFANDLYTINLTTGAASQVGSLAGWTFALAIVSPFTCDFSADETTICAGGTVNFTDESAGADSWEWTFEGGTPATSTDQNPSVEYSTPGNYDVTLEITNSAGSTKTETKIDFITVIETPAKASNPEGDEAVCTGQLYNYLTDEILYAEEYEWELSPAEAGILTPNDNAAEFTVDEEWTGDFTIRVRATNICGDGEWSDDLEGTVNVSPAVYTLAGGGGYCLDGDGVEITLSGSETDTDYELYLDDIATGNIVSGTGSSISFGLVTDEGFYSAYASNASCDIIMEEQIEVFIMFPPLEPATPTGPVLVCNDESSDYESEGSEDADSYEWILSPENAGTITSDGLTATIIWSSEFSGVAEVSLVGVNDCGEGSPAVALEVTVEAIPMPEISGADEVCDNTSEAYTTEEYENAEYVWEVAGGTISEGQGTNNIVVAWGEAGDGNISVSIETAAGCSGSSEEVPVFIDDCTGIDENGPDHLISLNPNPAYDHVTITANEPINSIRLFTLNGDIVAYIQADALNPEINISNLKPGIYLLRIEINDRILIKKLVVK
jgi:PKD repeat protein